MSIEKVYQDKSAAPKSAVSKSSSAPTYQQFPIDDLEYLAKRFASTGFCGIKKWEDMFVLMNIAVAEGKHPATAAREYYLFNGRVGITAEAIAARFQKSAGVLEWIEITDKVAHAKFHHPQAIGVEIKWTIEDAKKAGLISRNPNWIKYPRAMLRCRTLTEGVRTAYPECILGLKSQEEIMSMSPVDVMFREVKPEEQTSHNDEHIQKTPAEILEDFRIDAKVVYSNARSGIKMENEEIFDTAKRDWAALCLQFLQNNPSFKIPINVAENMHDIFGLDKPIDIFLAVEDEGYEDLFVKFENGEVMSMLDNSKKEVVND